ncbi:hypothetical protein M0R72_16955 [Candidatus Pacearchaeota archaeon]|jgi:hypothetical protein|nr:hypothetical protein [Candidatus Pacearchaeota archaeon]
MKKFLIIAMLLALIMPSALAIPEPYEMLKGNQMIPTGAPWMKDDAKMYFGTDKDSYIEFDAGTGYMVISGVAAASLTAGGTVGANNHLTCAAGTSKLDFQLGTGTTDTTTGTNTLRGNTVIEGSKTFTTGTGAVAINGDVTIAATKGITKTAGAGNFDFSAGTGTFLTSTGTNTLGGDVVIAETKNLTMSGASTLSTGTGAITLSGPVGIASGIDVTAAGGAADLDYALSSGFFKTPTGATTMNGAIGIASGVDITAAGGASDINYAASSGAFTTPTGTTTLSGAVSVAANKGITAASGTGAFNFGAGSGIFTTSTGANTLSGDTTISGSKTFTTGTGAITLKGDVSIDAAKKLTKGTTLDRVLTKTADYTITDTDPDVVFIGAITALATATIVLPTAADNTGREITVIVAGDPGTNDVVIDGEGGETINGAATKTNSDIYSVIKTKCNGAAWFISDSSGTWT